jgi:hypothetical protein
MSIGVSSYPRAIPLELLVRLGCGASLSMTRRELYRLVGAVTIDEVRLQKKYSYSVESIFVGSFKSEGV